MSLDLNKASLIDIWRNKSARANRPLQGSLELTYRCNERCTHCYIEKFWDDPKKILTLEQWKHCLNELKSAGVLYLIFMGGEAMLNPHFWDIAEEASRLGFHLSMITNGQKTTCLETAHRIKTVGFSVITVSLYSLQPEIHDKMTAVKGSHAKTLAAIDYYLQAGLTVGINCLLTSANIEGYFELADWCIERQIEIKADPHVTPKFNKDLAPTKLRATPEQLQVYFEKLVQKWPAGTPKATFESSKDFICNAGKGKCAVTPYGELLTCIEVREPLGLLTEKSFEELWNGPVAEKWRNLKVGSNKNRDTDGTESFCDHCPGMALHEDNDPLKISSYSKIVANIKKDVARKQAQKKLNDISIP